MMMRVQAQNKDGEKRRQQQQKQLENKAKRCNQHAKHPKTHIAQ